MEKVKPEAEVLNFKEEKNKRKPSKKTKDGSYKPDFSKFQTYLNKSDKDKKQ